MGAAERLRNGAPRPSRLASPPPNTPSGPAAGTNNIPLGPRGVPNAPSGPKLGSQIPRDYQKGVSFVNGSGINGAATEMCGSTAKKKMIQPATRNWNVGGLPRRKLNLRRHILTKSG